MKFNGKMIILLCSIASFLSACTGGTSDPVKNHSAATTSNTSAGKTPAVSVSPQLQEEEKRIQNLSLSPDFKRKEEYFLNIKNWDNTAISQTDTFKSFINDFQRDLLQKLNSQPEESELEKLSNFYSSFCSPTMTDCRHIKTLKTSPYASQVLTAIAQKTLDVHQKMRLNLLALEVSNQVLNQAAATMLLTEANGYKSALKKDSTPSGNTLIQKIDSYLEQLIALSESEIIKIDPEILSNNFDLLNSQEEGRLSLAGNLYVKNYKGENLHDKIQSRLEKLKESPSGYTSKIKWLESRAPQFLSQLKVQKLSPDNAFFAIEQIVQRQWTSRQAAAFIKGADISPEEISNKSKIYASNMVAYTIAAIQSELFASYKKNDVSDKNRYFYEAGSAINNRLVEARMLVDQLRVLVNLEEILTHKPQSELRTLIGNLPETFRLTVTDTVTLALLDRGLKLDVQGRERIPILNSSWSGYKTFNDYFIDMMNGTLEPLIQVTPLPETKSYFNMQDALEFALRTNFFGLKATDGDEALVRIFDFYSQLDVYAPNAPKLKEATQTRLSILNRSLKQVRNLQSNSFFQYSISQCSTIDNGGIRGSFDLLGLEASTTLGKAYWDLKSIGETRTDSINAAGSTSRINYAIFPASTIHADTLEWGRLDFLNRMNQFLIIADAVEANTNLRFPNFKKKVQEIRSLYTELYDRQMDLINQFLPCWYKLVNNERDISAKVLAYDKEFWKWVIRPENRQKAAQIFSRDLPATVKYRSQFSQDTVGIHNFDLLIRARYYLMYGFPDLNLPALSPGINITMTPDLGKEIKYKNSSLSTVNISSDINEFALNAIRASGYKTNNSSVAWYSGSFIPSAVLNQLLDVSVTLYKMGPMIGQISPKSKLMNVDQLASINEDIFKFINLSEIEMQAVTDLGEKKRFQSFGSIETPFLLAEDGSIIPVNEYLNKLLISGYAGSFGNVAVWEDPKSNMGLTRPRSLIPFNRLAKSLRQFLSDRKGIQSHLFAEQLTSTQLISDSLETIFSKDVAVRELVLAKLKTQPSLQMRLNTDKIDQVSGFNPFLVEDLKNSLEDFRQFIGKPKSNP